MRYLLYKSTNLLDSILLGEESGCRYIRLTDKDLKSRLFNKLLLLASKKSLFLPWLLKLIPAFRQLRAVSKGDTVIIFDIDNLTFIKYLKLSIPDSVHFHVFYWNPIDKMFGADTQSAISSLKDMGAIISTFDKKDADSYQLIYKDQFIRPLPVQPTGPEYDYYFIGQSKGREKVLERITYQLKAEGLDGLCLIPKSPKEQISYQENIGNVLNSKCLLEIVQAGQSGITLRALEALIYQKKLITTCKDIVNYDFYHPKNIMIWNDEITHLKPFIQSESNPIDEHIIKKYSFKNWIQSFT